MNKSIMLGAVLVATAGAAAQNLLHNGGFEIPGPAGGAEGWRAFNSAQHRTVGDGLGPILVRSGNSSIELASGAFTFVGFTTDVFNPNTLRWYNPPYVYLGGPVTVSGYYAIPADQPLTGTNAGLKLEFQREPPNFSIYAAFEVLSISGHTDGQWVPFSMTVTDAQMPIAPEPPTNVHVLPLRFGLASSTGTIFWDDITFSQALTCYANCDHSTISPVLNVQDFGCFLNKFAAGDPYANCDKSTIPPVLNVQDFGCFLNKFAAGCS